LFNTSTVVVYQIIISGNGGAVVVRWCGGAVVTYIIDSIYGAEGKQKEKGTIESEKLDKFEWDLIE
jgi:hypothetical protein